MAITNTYLNNPDDFFSHLAGKPWGAHEIFIDFVGGPYHVNGLNNQQLKRLQDHFGEACIAKDACVGTAVPITVRKLSASHFCIPKQKPRNLDFDLEAQEHLVKVSGEHLCGSIEQSDGIRGCLATSRDDNWFTRNVFENFFRMLVTYRLLETGGMLLHSAGIVSNGAAFLFPGRSGDGKSTLSRLSLEEGKSVLSDDMNAVTWRNGEPWVEKVPFTGDLGQSWTKGSAYPLRGLFSIHKSNNTTIQPMGKSQAVALLTSSAPYLNADPSQINNLLESLAHLTQITPTHILNFSLSGDIWKTIDTVFPVA